jgi:hypothetical protein
MEVRVHLVHVKSICLEPGVMEHSGHIWFQNVCGLEDNRVHSFELAKNFKGLYCLKALTCRPCSKLPAVYRQRRPNLDVQPLGDF